MENKSKWQEFVRSYSVWDDENIKGFFGYGEGEYGWLSNFYPCEVVIGPLSFPSSESAYMSFKTLDTNTKIKFSNTANPILSSKEAKALGQTIKLRSDWEEIKYDAMLACVFDKFWRNKDLREKLLATGDKYLEERNHWRDFCWGVDYKTGEGKNWLGQILMKVRWALKRY